VVERVLQHLSDRYRLRNEFIDLRRLFTRERSPSLRRRTAFDAFEQHLGLDDAEADVLGKAHHRQSLQHAIVVASPTAHPRRLGKQAKLLVVADRRRT